MTQRSKSALDTLFADNTSGDISAQDLRDGFDSIFGGYGGLYLAASVSPPAVGTTQTKLAIFDTAMPDDGTVVVGNPTDDDIDVTIAGDYEVHFETEIQAPSNAVVLSWEVFVNGVGGHGISQSIDASGGADTYERKIDISGIITVGAAEVVEVRWSAASAGTTCVHLRARLWMKRLS